ncbi:hypothetical protein L3X38_030922 [Prunus dulcis]|uniref:Uncharacterized protein n=1 Tax=Prunus dulcis TaxID=3755 RepID=A0AAD4YUG4_PRUDU|nr:hypothetical protein L3X38_030922 [Prunus dulcis]
MAIVLRFVDKEGLIHEPFFELVHVSDTEALTLKKAQNIDILDMNARYVARRGQARHQQDDFTIKHYYMIDMFYAAIESQLQELNSRFSDQTIELLILGLALDPREVNNSFRIDDICQLVDKFYPKTLKIRRR